MRFIVFENLKHAASTVTRVYPVHNIKYFEYDKAKKMFKFAHVDGTWHTITNDGPEILRNERVFEQVVALLREKATFK